MKRGPKTKYTPALLQRAEEYISNYKESGHTIPSIVGLARVLDITSTTIYDWKNDPEKTEISCILQKILDAQHNILIDNGLSGAFNAAITKLVLGKHGYHEKQDTHHSGPDGRPIEVDQTWEIKVVE